IPPIINPGGPIINPGGPIINPGGPIIDPRIVIVNPGGGLIDPGAVFDPDGGLVGPTPIVVDPIGPLPGAGRGAVNPGSGVLNPSGGLFGPATDGVVAAPLIRLNLRVFSGGSGAAPMSERPEAAVNAEPGRPVTDVRGVGEASAEKLAAINIASAEQLAAAAPEHVAQVLGISEVRAMGLVESARQLLRDEG
ncbi:MAG: hypothetical protein HC822_25750, partial [Oscillochloris sp.]|nr:hypothetical protein [Oscillochloris sp.]